VPRKYVTTFRIYRDLDIGQGSENSGLECPRTRTYRLVSHKAMPFKLPFQLTIGVLKATAVSIVTHAVGPTPPRADLASESLPCGRRIPISRGSKPTCRARLPRKIGIPCQRGAGDQDQLRLNGIGRTRPALLALWPSRSFPFWAYGTRHDGTYPYSHDLRPWSAARRPGTAGGCGWPVVARVRVNKGCRWCGFRVVGGWGLRSPVRDRYFRRLGARDPCPFLPLRAPGRPPLQERAGPGITSCGSPAGAGEWLGSPGAYGLASLTGGGRGPVRTARPGARSTVAVAPACRAAAGMSWPA
jgi:hypothetical protein